ncbi:MAG: regulatory iron-sulfur-containing complex subunit RicT [Nitrospirota bacterium]|jgi:cell fate regulator YaaT (PSP1 superfamily)
MSENGESIVGIKFEESGKTYCFTARGLQINQGDRVVVESDLGISIGRVVALGAEPPPEGKRELKPVLRKVTEVDLRQEEENEGVRREAFEYCKERIRARGLRMKLLSNEVTLDRRRFIFYFVADSRIDFRELVKDLASKFRTRIELRQIGVRDAARMVGGYGVCGKEFCCKSFLRSFAPISIKMAKQQDLVLNTCKLSGVCGRLMCCLSYEYHSGRDARKKEKAPPPELEAAAREELRELESAAGGVEVLCEEETVPALEDMPGEAASPSPGLPRPEEDGASVQARTLPSGERPPRESRPPAEGAARKPRRRRRRRKPRKGRQ